MLAPLWRDGHRYMKVGVMLDDLRDKATQPRPMFPTRDPAHSAALMRALDQVNARYGRGTLRPLATGTTRPWGTRAERLTSATPPTLTSAGRLSNGSWAGTSSARKWRRLRVRTTWPPPYAVAVIARSAKPGAWPEPRARSDRPPSARAELVKSTGRILLHRLRPQRHSGTRKAEGLQRWRAPVRLGQGDQLGVMSICILADPIRMHLQPVYQQFISNTEW